jgi:acyl dehydratase
MPVKTEEPSTGASTSRPKSETMQNAAFDPSEFLMVPARTFADLRVGDVFRAPSRTLTDAHASAFQAVSADNHPVH